MHADISPHFHTNIFSSYSGTLSVSVTFLCYGLLCGLAIIFIWLCIPETKGKSLEEISSELQKWFVYFLLQWNTVIVIVRVGFLLGRKVVLPFHGKKHGKKRKKHPSSRKKRKKLGRNKGVIFFIASLAATILHIS